MTASSSFSLAGKVIVQFGGSGLLGRALVSALADAGATLVLASRNRAALDAQLARELTGSREIWVEEVELAAEPSILALRARLAAKFGSVDGVVFNAVTRPMSDFQADLARWRESMEVNATGFFATMRAFGDMMAERGRGSLVNISSQMGMIGVNPWLYGGTSAGAPPDYFFHKGGMINLTRYLASHYGHRGVRVNTVSPGGIFNPAHPPGSGFLERYATATMLGRMAEAREIGGAVTFLLSDASTYITGANLPVDGGYTAK